MQHLSALTLIGVLAAAAAAVAPAQAQAPPPPGPAKGPPSIVIQGTASPERVDAELDALAKKRDTAVARGRVFFMFHADNAAELAALGRSSVMLLTVLSQKREELPLARVYSRIGGQDTPLVKLSSWRSDTDAKRLAHKIYGPHREDGFYLIPTRTLTHDGQVLIDFAANAKGMVILQLPSATAPGLVKKFPDLDAAPGGSADLKALQAFIARKFPGFPVPKAVP